MPGRAFRIPRGAALGLAAASVALAVAPAPPTPTPMASPSPSFHWKSAVTSAETRSGDRLQEAEIWLDGGRMRLEDRTRGVAPMNLVATDRIVWVWQPGSSAGTKMGTALARKSGRPSHDYARRIQEIRARGRRVRSESLDGHACDVVEFDSPEEGKGTYWLAKDLGDFPLRIVLVRPEMYLPYRGAPIGQVRLEYRNSAVRIPAGIDPAALAPPAEVRFEDATEIFLNKGRPLPKKPAGP